MLEHISCFTKVGIMIPMVGTSSAAFWAVVYSETGLLRCKYLELRLEPKLSISIKFELNSIDCPCSGTKLWQVDCILILF
jgi:hypothetical protein